MDIQGKVCECDYPPCICESTNSSSNINITDVSDGDYEGKIDFPIQISGYFNEE